jgi:hypothetical protein
MDEAWLEVNVRPRGERDERLLLDVVAPIVRGPLADEVETWFFFWEPELRLRVRWRRAASAGSAEAALKAHLDALGVEWWEGAHGERGRRYEGEAEDYGTEVWQLVQKDWMSASRLALAFAELEPAGRLTRTREYHWSRRVHLFSNQVFGDWPSEVRLCLAQARWYLARPELAGLAPERDRLLAELDRFLG